MFGIKEGRPGKLWTYLDKFHGMKINNRYLLRGTRNKSNKTVWWLIYFWCSWRIGSARTIGCHGSGLCVASAHVPVCLTFEVSGKSSHWLKLVFLCCLHPQQNEARSCTAHCWGRERWQLAARHWHTSVRCFPVYVPPGNLALGCSIILGLRPIPNLLQLIPKTAS